MRSNIGAWCQTTTCHGILDLWQARTWLLRALWALLLLASLGIMVSQIFDVVRNFCQSEKWSTSVMEKRSSELEFPYLSICNYNRISKKRAAKLNMTEDLITALFQQPRQMAFLIQKPMNFLEFIESSAEWRRGNNITTSVLWETLGMSCAETFARFAFKGKVLTSELCSGNETFTMEKGRMTLEPLDTLDYGKCHQVKVHGKATGPGQENGYSLLLNAQIDDYVDVVVNNYLDEGFLVQLSSTGGVVSGKWIAVEPGKHTLVAMKLKKTSMDDGSSSSMLRPILFHPPCTLEKKLQILPDSVYTKEICAEDCNLVAWYEVCNCIPYYNEAKKRPCEFEDIAQCVGEWFSSNSSEYAKYLEIIKMCINEKCKEPCEDDSVEVSISSTKFVAKNQRKKLLQIGSDQLEGGFLPENITIQYFQDNFALLDIYFESMAVQVVGRFEAMTLDQLISNFGGQLGLWAGISVLTVAQALIWLSNGLNFCTSCKKQKSLKRTAPAAELSETGETRVAAPERQGLHAKNTNDMKF